MIKIIAGVIFTITFLLLGFNNSLRANYYPNLANTEELIFDIDIKGDKSEESIVAYLDDSNGNVFIPFTEIISALDLPIEITSNSKMDAWFNSKQSIIKIDLEKQSISVNSVSIPFAASDIRVDNNEIYMTNTLIERVLSIKLNINKNTLTIYIDAPYELPVERKYNLEQNRKSIPHQSIDNAKYTVSNTLFTPPSLDFYQSYGRQISATNRTTFVTTALYLGGVVAGLDSNVIVTNRGYSDAYSNYYNAYNIRNTLETRMYFSKTYIDEKKYGVRYFSFGDITSYASDITTSAKGGRGLYVSSDNDYNINIDKTTNIEGVLPLGWEVELYRNNQLIDFRASSSDSLFSFKNVVLISGSNVFKLIFYGPFGETREEYRRYLVGVSPTSSGEFAFRAYAMQNNRKMIENGVERKQYENYTRVDSNFKGFYGLNDNISLSAELSTEEQPDNPLLSNNFYAVGSIISAFGLSANYDLAVSSSNNNIAQGISLFGNMLDGNLYASYNNFNNIKSSQSYINGLYASKQLQGRYSTYFNIFNKFNLPINLGYEKIYYKEEDNLSISEDLSYQKYYVTLSSTLFHRYFFTLENNYYKFYNNEIANAKLLFSTRFFNFGFRGEFSQNILPQRYANYIKATLDSRIYGTNFYHFIKFSYFFKSIYNTRSNLYEYGLATTTRFGSFSFNVNTDSNKNHGASVSYKISFGYNKFNKKIYIEPEHALVNSASIVAQVFIDNNKNGVYDHGVDEAVPNAKININSFTPDKTTNKKDGILNIAGITPYQKNRISLDKNSLEDVMLKPKGATVYNLILKPSVPYHIAFPLVRSGDIEGLLSKDDKPVAFARVSLYDKNNNLIGSMRTDSRGNYLFERVDYGTYYIKAKDQTTKPFNVNKDVVYTVSNI